MKIFTSLYCWAIFALFASLCTTPDLQAQITGTVFRDYNGNGTQDANEPFLSDTRVSSLVFVDAQVEEAEALRQAVEPQDEVFYLFSHGRPGQLLLEGKWLAARDIADWLMAKGLPQRVNQINLYGCQFARGPVGLEAVRMIEQTTGLRVAASSNITGIGGDWVLEIGNEQLAVNDYPHSLQLIEPLTNGTFESPAVTGDRVPAIPTGWTRLSGATFLTAPSKLELGAVGTTTRLLQTFTVTDPGIYQLFLNNLKGASPFGGTTADLDVLIDGNLEHEFNVSETYIVPYLFSELSLTAGAHTIELRVTNVSYGPAGPQSFNTPGVSIADIFLVRVSDSPADPTGAVSGTVFRDYNGNGLKEADEPLMPGVTVNAYDATDALCGTAVTQGGISGPNYSLTGCGTGPVRVEFVMPTGEALVDADTDFPSLSGNTHGTSVQFVNGNSSDVNFAISNPKDYNVGSPEVDLFLPCYISGDPLAGGTTGTTDWFVSFDYPVTSSSPPPNRKVDGTTLGATWGTAYSKQADRVFTSAILKRHIGLGTLGTGGIYMLEPTATSFNVTEFYDMDANGHRTRAAAGAVAYGDGSSYQLINSSTGVTYLGPNDPITGQPEGLGVVGTNVQRGLNPDPATPDFDPAAFNQVGKVGLGGLEISDDGRFLFVMNLYSRSVFRLELDDAANPTAVVNVTEISLPAISCTNGEFRPWALTYHRGKLYAGGVCTGEYESDPATNSGLFAYVFELDNPETGTAFSGSSILSFPLDYNASGSPSTYLSWHNQANYFTRTGYYTSQQPLLADLTFGNNGQMVLNLLDRWGLQQQSFNYFYLSNSNFWDDIRVVGDILVAGVDAATGTYQLESNNHYTSNGITYIGSRHNIPQFFYDLGGFLNNTLGASSYLPGLPGVTATMFTSSSQRAYDLSLFDGNPSNEFFIAAGGGVEEKGLGLGETEFSGPDAPLEIGNRVWNDLDEDGIQDPDEAPIPGIEVQLWKDDGTGTFTQIATVTTAADGTYYFSSATGTSAPGITYNVAMLQPNMNYELRFPTTATVGPDVLNLTSVNMGGTDPNADARDSDADMTTGVVPLTTAADAGANDHSFDVGYSMITVANLELEKTFVSATPNGGGAFTVNYTVTVMETNGAPTTYELTDTPGFDDDITINSGSYSGQATGPLGAGTNTLAPTGTPIGANATHTYNLSFNVTLDLTDGSGNNTYTPCDGTTPMPGQGLYNVATLTTNGMSGDADDCGDLPNVVLDKAFVDAVENGDGTFTVTYEVTVENNGGASTTYDLSDLPEFDDDVTINSGTFSGQNSGSLNTTGSTTLATGESIAAGATHTYNLTFNVTLDLAGGGGDNTYDACDGTTPVADQGLFNTATLTFNGVMQEDEDCGDLPNVVLDKAFVDALENGDGTFTVTYEVTVENNGGASTTYDLSDLPEFDDDVTINSGTFSGQNSGSLNTTGSTTLATGESIAAGATHTYNLSFNVTLDLAGGGGDNTYDACDGTTPTAGQGLFNEATLTSNGETQSDDDCGDLPNVVLDKAFVDAVENGDGTFTVTYEVTVENNGGASTTYDLSDLPEFDDDVTINSGTFSGQNSGSLNTTGSTTLATGESIAAGAMHTYNLSFIVELDLVGGGGDNSYTACDGTTPMAGEGLFNTASLTTNGMMQEAEDCGDLPPCIPDVELCPDTPITLTADPGFVNYQWFLDGNPIAGATEQTYSPTVTGEYTWEAMDIAGCMIESCCSVVVVECPLPVITLDKMFVSAVPSGSGTFSVSYTVTVTNSGGAAGTYDLSDTPGFDDDVTINSGTFSGQNSGSLNTTGSTTLATGESIAAGAMHTYNLSFIVELDLAGGGGDNTYDACDGTTPTAGQGLFNEATLTSNGEMQSDDDCGDLPNVVLDKAFVDALENGDGTFTVTYEVTVENNGGASTTYDLSDLPEFDDDVTINSGTFSGQNSGSLNTTGSTTLATGESIAAGATHTYNLSFNVTLDLAGGGGDNTYDACDGTTPVADQGLFNTATLTSNGVMQEDEDCGDLPNVVLDKAFVDAVENGDGTFTVTYEVTVENNGGASTTYDLSDLPEFDDDVTINSGTFSGQNSGSLNTTGSTTLATGESIAAGATHTYNLSFIVELDLAGGGGDNTYDACDGTTPVADQGLFNTATLTFNGVTQSDEDCGDLPNVVLDIDKSFVSAVPDGGGNFDVTYRVTVTNSGAASGTYDLTDTPGFDDDVSINSGGFMQTMGGSASGTFSSPSSGNQETLVTGVSLAAGATHTYELTFNVTLDLVGGGGDNSYTACDGTTPTAGQGLFNEATLTSNGEMQSDDDCGDLPNVVLDKAFVDALENGDGTFTVTYEVTVENNGGASTTYDLSDLPEFDDDVTINSGTFSGQNSGSLNTTGSTTLATGESIAAGAMHTYELTFNVTLDLAGGGGDNTYDACDGTTPVADQGLFNTATLTFNGVTQSDDDCGDLPNVVLDKAFVDAVENGDGTFTVTYEVTVENNGGASTTYDLSDLPEFDDDVTINSGTFSGQNSGSLNTTGSTTLATGESIAAGATHTYNLTFNVTLDLAGGGGDNTYDACDGTTPVADQGLFNTATLTFNGVMQSDDDCGDLPNVVLDKAFVDAVENGDGTFTVTYEVTVENNGGASTTYDLSDLPEFDDDVTINSGTFSGQNSGSLNTTGSTTLATGESIAAGATHTYNLTFNVTLDLAGGGGDNTYDACDGTTPVADQGLFNTATLTFNGEMQSDDDCGDLPNVVLDKAFVDAVENGDGTFTVTYEVTVENNGGASTTYDLSDLPEFDDDVTINSGTFSGQNSGSLNTTGSTTLATGESIAAGATHTYNLTFNVTLDLAGGGGDNTYDACDGTTPVADQGLFNTATLTFNGVMQSDDDCGDLPNVVLDKAFVDAVENGDGTFTVTYEVTVENNGGASTTYDLSDLPEFDDDVTINSGTFSGQNSGSLNTTGSTTLATGESIAAGATHTYNLSFNVTLDLAGGGGDNTYDACDGTTPVADQGLFNTATLTFNGEMQSDDDCGDLPNVVLDKAFVDAVENGDGTFTVTYEVTVENNGGASTTYDLSDLPEFDDDVTINSGTFSGQNSGSLNTTGSTTLATGESIAAGATHTYNLSFNVTLDLAGGGGDNTYDACDGTTPVADQGLFNTATLTFNGVMQSDDDCGDLPNVVLDKAFVDAVENGDGTFTVTYEVTVENNGGASTTYDLSDLPEFDDDVTINSGTFSGQNSGSLNTTGSTTLATGESIAAGATHTYNLTFNVTLDLAGGGGDNTYDACDGTTPVADQGLFNTATLTFNGVMQSDDDCGDLPNVVLDKAFVDAVENGDGTFTVTYEVTVENNGGASTTYDLSDLPEFDDDVTINSGTFSGQNSGSLNTTGSTTLATGESIAAGATHTYNLTFNVTLDLAGGGGDNTYDACDGTTPVADQGLFNTATLTFNGVMQSDDDCGDLPNVVLDKAFVDAVENGDGTFTVTYEVTVENNGGASTTYDLSDLPEFDDDVTINSGTFSGQNSGSLNTTGSTTLATGESIAAGATHTYNLTFNVTLDLAGGGGDNTYDACDGTTPVADQGLFNTATLTFNGEMQSDDDCGDLPNVVLDKAFVDAVENGDGTFTVTYEVTVENNGGASTTYDLSDLPEFDDDVTINSGTFSGQNSGSLNTTGSTTLATGESIAAGATHTYNLTFNVTLDLAGGGGDNTYDACDGTTPVADQGLFNTATLTFNGEMQSDDDCGDLPNVVLDKAFVDAVENGDGTFTVTYEVTVENNGGASTTYDLSDLPEFDDDVTINSGTFSGQNSGSLNTTGSTTLATGESIAAGATHTYNLSFNVTLDLAGGGGDNTYDACDGTTPVADQGLFNTATLTFNGVMQEDEDCGDLPNVVLDKAFVDAVENGDGTFTVTYEVTVENNGGASTTYDLSDLPEFDDDVTINSGTFSGQNSGSLNTTGSTTLATGESIAAGATHTYNLTFNVTLDLAGGGGDNTYDACDGTTPVADQGLFNTATLTSNGVMQEDEDCGDLPILDIDKSFVSAAPDGGGNFDVTYRVTVTNSGAASGTYDLTDTPGFDDDVSINSGGFMQTMGGSASGTFSSPSSGNQETLVTGVSLAAGATHTYELTFNVTLDLAGGGGDNSYTACDGTTPTAGQGLFNEATLTSNGVDQMAEDCGDLEISLGSIGNYVWVDENSDGLQDEGEVGIPNVRVVLKDETVTEIAETYTDSKGGYLFPDLPEGDYYVDVDETTLPGGMTQTTTYTNGTGDLGNKDHGGNGYAVTLGDGEENLTADFGYNHNPDTDVDGGTNTAALGDRVWIDSDGNGVQDPNEVGVSGVEVTLTGAGPDGIFGTGDDISATTQTDENGNYLFDGLAPGAYVTEVTNDGGASHPVLGNDYAQSGDPDDFGAVAQNPDNLQTEPVVLGPGDVFLNSDYGYEPQGGAQVGSIGNTVWLDADADGNGPSDSDPLGDGDNGLGVEDDNLEEPIASVTVSLIRDDNNNGVWDAGEPIVATDVTDADGEYLFEDLAYDDYIVWVNDADNVLQGLENSFDEDGGMGTDATGVGNTAANVGGMSAVTISSGDPDNRDQDFGYTPAGHMPGEGYIGNYVWFDTDGDDTGGQTEADNEGDSGIEGVVMELLNNAGTVIATTTTDENGFYYFGNLFVDADGEGYQVRVAGSNFAAGGVLENMTGTYDPDGGSDDQGGLVSLSNGTPGNLDQDFGYTGSGTPGSIGTTVWEDTNANGVLDAGEQGISGVTIDLYRDLDGNDQLDPGEPLIGTQTTDGIGNYSFDNLPEGDYIVDVTDTDGVLGGYWHSLGDQSPAVDNNSKSDAFAVSLGAGEDNPNVDFGYYVQPAAVGNYVWLDVNGDGLQNDGETGINGVEVQLQITYPDNTMVTLTTVTANDDSGNPGFYDFGNLLLDEDYNGDGTGPEPSYQISVDPNQTVLTNNNLVSTVTDVNSDGNDLEDSDPFAGVAAQPVQGNQDTDALDPTDTEDPVASYDFGVTPQLLGSIGNYVWVDENSDGLQDEGEVGIPNVRVVLKDETVTEIAETYTDSKGGYLFPDLPEGDYYVDVDETTLPGGMTQTTTYTNGTGDLGNKDHGGNGYAVTLGDGEENLTADFGYNHNPDTDVDGGTNTAALGDRVWIDSDGNGVQDPNEVGVSGVEVTLTGAGPDGIFGTGDDISATTQTDENGNYLFDGLAPGAYVTEVTNDGGASHPVLGNDYAQSGDPDDFGAVAQNPDNLQTEPVVLGPGDVFLNSDYGYEPQGGAQVGSIGNTVWLDADADGNGPSDSDPLGDGDNGLGVEDDNLEEPIASVTVSLIRDDNNNGVWDAGEPIVATDVTDADGEYLFEDLAYDDYIVWVNDADNVLQGLENSFDEDGGMGTDATGVGNTAANVGGMSAVTISSGDPDNRDQDFGYTPAGHMPGEGYIGNYVWFDTDGDDTGGQTEADNEGDSGIEGVVMELLNNAGTVIATTTTDENGFYYFGNLFVDADGEGYQVRVAGSNFAAGGVLENMTGTYDPDGGSDDQGGLVSLSNGTPGNLDQDFGYTGSGTPGSIGTTVWEDTNANGVLDAGEQGISGVTIDLYRDLDGNDQLDPGEPLIGTQTTDGIGNYSFDNLPEGDYIVDVTDTDGVLGGYWHSLGDQSPAVDNNSKSDAFAVSLGAGEDNPNVDFGYYVQPAAVGNYVWLDTNGNGLQDDGETGINGVEVQLQITYPDNTMVTLTTVTANDDSGNPGFYDFGNLLLDEDYNGDGTGPEPSYQISVDPNQTVLTNNNLVSTVTDVNSDGNDLEDSDPFAGVAAQPVQGNQDTDALDPTDTEDPVASYDFGLICNVQVTVAEPFEICATGLADLTEEASILPAGLGGTWSTPDGDGTFDGGTDFATATTYTPGPQDRKRGSVTLVLTSNDPGCGPPESAQVTITIKNVDCGNFPWDGR